MTIHSTKKQARTTNHLAITGFVFGILTLFPPAITAWEAVVPSVPAMAELHFGHIPFLILFYFSIFGSIPFGIASLVTGWLALKRNQRSKREQGKTWAILGIVFGAAGLIYTVVILIHLVMMRQTPVTPLVPV